MTCEQIKQTVLRQDDDAFSFEFIKGFMMIAPNSCLDVAELSSKHNVLITLKFLMM